MKFLYGINSTGQGHINRSRVFIKKLQEDGHQVDLLYMGPKPPDYVREISPRILSIDGPSLVYNKSRVDIPRTAIYLTYNSVKYFEIVRSLLPTLKREAYDAYFTDFSIYTSLAGLALRKKVYSIDHQHSIFHPASYKPIGNPIDVIGARLAIDFGLPYRTQYYAIDYTDKMVKYHNGMLTPLVWKHELDALETYYGEHYCAYLAHQDIKAIYRTFTSFPEEKFILYGFNVDKQVKNIIFKKTSRKSFLEDMASSKAVITNGGFNTTWESVLLRKKLWTIPYGHQFEQITNAKRLRKFEFNYLSYEITPKHFQKFREFLVKSNYRPTKRLPIIDAGVILRDIYQDLGIA